jgi:coenzyme F420-reducing hydrogenase beta subunit
MNQEDKQFSMIVLQDKAKCCGCTVCYSMCPKKAIEMKADEEGFKYPQIDLEKCINCGLCEKVCPMLKKQTINQNSSVKYAVQNVNAAERYQSTAGGVFSVIADYVIEKSGIVFAVGFEGNRVVHKYAKDKENLSDMRGSKYVQSDIGSIFSEVKVVLSQKKLCLFVGTPCQIQGIDSFLKNSEYRDNLILIDLLCLGVSSPLLYEKWVRYLEQKYNSEVILVKFRDKSYGYSTANIRVEFTNGKHIEQCYDAKSYLKTFFSGYNMRPSCYDCMFRCVDRKSDFTIGDFHQIGKYSSKMDDDKGTTCVWAHTEKARELMNLLNDRICKIDIETTCSATLDTISMYTKIPANRNEFWDDVKNNSYIDIATKWAKNDLKGVIANICKPIINKTPFRTIFFRMIKKRKQKNFTKRIKDANN